MGGPRPEPGRVSLSKAQLEEFVHSLTKAIGTTGDARNTLAFAIGALCFERDPSVIGKTMEEKFKPLMEAGNVAEAE